MGLSSSGSRPLPGLLAVAVVAAALSAALAVAGWLTLPRLFGLVPLAVESASMEPTIAAGDLLFVDPDVDVDSLGPGQVVVFRAPGSATVTSHRVQQVPGDGTLITKGDANGAADSDPVPVESVLSVARLRVPGVVADPRRTTALLGLTVALGVLVLARVLGGGRIASGSAGALPMEEGVQITRTRH